MSLKVRLTVFSLFCLLLLGYLTFKVMNGAIFFYDQPIWLFLYSLRSSVLNILMRFVSFLGMYGVVFTSILILLYLYLKNKRYLALIFAVTLGTGEVVNVIFKNLVGRSRPLISPLVIEKDFGFPSGHSMLAVIFFVSVTYLYFALTQNKKGTKILAIISSFCILLIGISRVYLGVHYTSDVLAGFLTGFIWLAFIYRVQLYFKDSFVLKFINNKYPQLKIF
ncbi:phosphatase PAP2 family protein [bacterium]|nr:phosphatase PAP2 family protein [bacterium]